MEEKIKDLEQIIIKYKENIIKCNYQQSYYLISIEQNEQILL